MIYSSIGEEWWQDELPLYGVIQDVKIYPRILTLDEMKVVIRVMEGDIKTVEDLELYWEGKTI
jgi:hypothetical protein